ncbi:MAG TPA: hypothetical protein VFS04_06565 [Alphaproteobacteria bacterium]|nr:hypothetical protein [Alphaproteobacteria bacterium]
MATGYASSGLSAMPSIEVAPELYAPLPSPDDPASLTRMRDDSDFGLRAAREATALAGRLIDAPPDMAKGLTRALLERFDEESAALAEGAPTPLAESDARAAIGRARGRLLDWALPQEAAARTVARRKGLVGALAQFRAAAAADPDMVDAFHAEGAAAIKNAGPWLGADEAGWLGDQWRQEIYSNSLIHLIDRSPKETARYLAEHAYENLLDKPRQTALLQRAEWLVQANSHDDARSQRRAADQADLQRQAGRWKFHADFARALRDGTAQYKTIYEAFEAGQVSESDRNTYEDRLRARDAADMQERDRIASVNRLLDGDESVRPSVGDISAHYRAVMQPIIEQTPSEDRGRIYLDYLKKLEHHDVDYDENEGSVDIDLTPPTDEAVDPQAMHAMLDYDPNGDSEAVLSLSDLQNAARVGLNAHVAFQSTEELFVGLPTHNTPADAFRHAYWNFVMMRGRISSSGEYGPEKVKKFTDAHEVEKVQETYADIRGREYGSQSEDERLMDLYNNEVGRRLALLPENRHVDPRKIILRALAEGKLQTRKMTIMPGKNTR